MHAHPPVYHRDIRASNIIKRADGSGYFLIDWSDASGVLTRGVIHLTEFEHSPRVRHDNHGLEVYIWGIGKCMENWAFFKGIAKTEAVQEMAHRWMEDI